MLRPAFATDITTRAAIPERRSNHALRLEDNPPKARITIISHARISTSYIDESTTTPTLHLLRTIIQLSHWYG
jgi:hypothetical protein